MALPILDGNQSATTLSTILTGGAHIPAHTVISLGTQAISDITSAVSGVSVSISGTQTTTFSAVTGSVSVLNFPSTQTIAGTVTVGTIVNCSVEAAEIIAEGIRTFGDVLISGTVTANVTNSVTVGAIIGPIGGSVFKGNSGSVESIRALPYFSQSGVANYNELSTSNPFPVAGTVTVGALPSGALTTRFGSVTTANLAFITSAVTNTSRKYLLAQNISAGTVTIGIGFSPTTTQGIQLAAGGGLTFDAFCPTGAVYWLGAVTGAAFTILEG